MYISSKQILLKFLKYYILFFIIAYLYLMSSFFIKFADIFEKEFPGWFYLDLFIYNSVWTSIFPMIYATIPSCLLVCKDFIYLGPNKHKYTKDFSIFSFFRPIFLISILLGLIVFVCMNYILPDSNYQARIYLSHIRFSEQFDKTKLERMQKGNYRSNREKSIQMIQQDLNDTEDQLKKLEKSKNEKKVMIQEHYLNEMRQSNIRLCSFFIIPSYLISIVIFAIPFGIIIRRINRILLLLISFLLFLVFHILFVEFEQLTANIDYPFFIIFIPESLLFGAGSILLFYLNNKYVIQNSKG